MVGMIMCGHRPLPYTIITIKQTPDNKSSQEEYGTAPTKPLGCESAAPSVNVRLLHGLYIITDCDDYCYRINSLRYLHHLFHRMVVTKR